MYSSVDIVKVKQFKVVYANGKKVRVYKNGKCTYINNPVKVTSGGRADAYLNVRPFRRFEWTSPGGADLMVDLCWVTDVTPEGIYEACVFDQTEGGSDAFLWDDDFKKLADFLESQIDGSQEYEDILNLEY